MTTSRAPQIGFTLGIIAWACAALWLVGPLLCSAERISGCLDHDQADVGQAGPEQHHNTTPAHEHNLSHGAPEGRSHHAGMPSHEHRHGDKSKNDSDKADCCSSIQALIATAKPVIVASPISQPGLIVCLLNTARENTAAASQCGSLRPARPRGRVSTHEVCLDPAHRPLGPPSSSSEAG